MRNRRAKTGPSSESAAAHGRSARRWASILALSCAACTGTIADPDDPIVQPRPADPGNPQNPGRDAGVQDPQADAGPGDSGGFVPPPPPPFSPAPPVLHRLTRAEYLNTVTDLLGQPLVLPQDLEIDTSLYGFTTVGASSLTIGPRSAEQYEAAALSLAEQVFAEPARRAAFVGCEPAAADDPCVRAFLERFGRRAFRRPLSVEELNAWSGVVVSIAATLRSVNDALELTVAGLLQSPAFLYRVEIGEPDPSDATRRRFTGYEIAARLSSLIWRTTPDEALLRAAASGDLDTVAGIERETERLLASPRSREALAQFFREHLKLDRLDTVSKHAETFPQMSPTMTRSMKREIETMIADIAFDRDADLRELFETNKAWVNEDLARVYNLPGEFGAELTASTHPANSPRSGIITTAGFLALNAHETITSPTFRGRFIRQSLLCQEIPPPPPGVVTELPEPEPGAPPQTLRQRLETLHLKNASCAGCHLRMDPIGFGLEGFDAIGAYRTTDNGLPVDTRSNLDGRDFRNAKELSRLLKDHPELGPCLARMTYRFATGHLETAGELIILRDLAPAFAQSGFRFQSLIRAIVTSDGFRYAGLPE